MWKSSVGLIAIIFATSSLTNPAWAQSPAAPAAESAPTVWDLTQLYPTDAAWDAERKAIADAIPGLATFNGTLGKDAGSLAKALRIVSDLRKRLSRLDTYAGLKRDENTKVAANEDRLERAELLGTDFASATSFIDPEVIAVGQPKIDHSLPRMAI